MTTVSVPHPEQSPPQPTPQTSDKERRRTLISSFLGSTVEYYDFLLYGAAAGLVFPHLFFDKNIDPFLGQLFSYMTLFTGYLARPVGGLIFGHLGDRHGRKNILFVTLMVMGLVSIAIGLLPTYATIGVAAPITLVLLRMIQGLAVGGEWAGATLMAAEHAKAKSRGIAASIAVSGGPAGAVLSTLVLGIFAGLPQEQFLSWGWRIPFLLSALLVIIGLYMRYQLTESPEFEAAKAAGHVETGVPLKRIFTVYPKQTILAALAITGSLFIQALMAVAVVPYLVDHGLIEQQPALMMLTFSAFLHIFAIPFFAWLSDRVGRKRVMLLGAAISIALIFPMFAAFNSGNSLLIFFGFILGNPIIQASMYGPVGAFLAERFAPEDRYTGVSVTYQLGSVLGAGLAPIISSTLLHLNNGWGTTNIALYFIALMVISALCVVLDDTPNREKTRVIDASEPV
ncbi:MFS transporter [Corynebacterium poyangense]|uniref:MFS transporter n=1 Tax=Corynebacterium poyangense TaxID=2684405 RepID=A0A7H0SM61_9CORY|nr:MFS transporter [Corynebacterium poyangense]MBZ8176732.1 MFS transporter [Corynebacterium poyangense]QNQ89636.1 MFS transporter [Corynebacterium poyangense]